MKHLRRASLSWDARNECFKKAHVGRNQYLCAFCNKSYIRKQVQADHRTPVIPLSGFDSFDGVIRRLFCGIEDLDCLCLNCHEQKTLEEDKLREFYRGLGKDD